MSNLRDTILLNGKVYAVGNDAIMAPVFPLDIVRPSSEHTRPHHKQSRHAKDEQHESLVLDKAKTQSNHHKAKRPHAPSRPAYRTGRHISAHKRQRSQTLMRHIVKKPVKTRVEIAEKPVKEKPEERSRLFTDLPNSGRVKRAIETPRSRHVSRFHHTRVAVHVKRNVPLAVKAEPSISISEQPDEIDMLIRSLARS